MSESAWVPMPFANVSAPPFALGTAMGLSSHAMSLAGIPPFHVLSPAVALCQLRSERYTDRSIVIVQM